MKFTYISTSLFAFFMLIISCGRVGNEINHNYHSGKIEIKDSIVPEKNGSYTNQLIKLKGFTNDSIYVNFGKGSFKKYFKGNIDITLNPDYYGGVNANFEFNSYKATEGNLHITFGIY
jgi:hypothetical protein